MKKKKQRGKKKFGRFFLRRLLVCPLLFLVLFNIYYIRKYFLSYQSYYYSSFRYNNEYMEGRLKRADKKQESISEFLTHRATSFIPAENFIMLVHPETGEFYNSEPYATASVWQDGNQQIFRLDDRSLVDRLGSSLNLNMYDHGTFIVYSIYIKDGQFIPGEVYMQKETNLPYYYFPRDGKIIPGEWVDLSPADTEGWTKIVSDKSKDYLTSHHCDMYSEDEWENDPDTIAKKLSTDGKMHLGYIRIYGSANAPHAEKLKEEIKEKLNSQEFKDMIRAQKEELYKEEHKTFTWRDLYLQGDHVTMSLEMYLENIRKKNIEHNITELEDVYYRSEIENADSELYVYPRHRWLLPYSDNENYAFRSSLITFRNEKWVRLDFWYVDAWKYFRYEFFVRLVEDLYYQLRALVAGIFTALIWAYISYLIYSRRYDIEAYRRNLTGTLAHDLKTPLAVIYGNAENLRAHTHPENADEYADCIMENVTHIDEMIAGVLGLAQLERSALPKCRKSVDLTALVHTAFQRNAAQMEARGLTLSESGTTVVRGNSEMLTQLAENLVSNAVQHTAEGGKITVTADKKRLRISNPYTGELDEKKLCEPFRRGDAARGSQSGTGLGLSIVQQIAALHKIRLRVTARNGIFTAELRIRLRARKAKSSD